MKTYEIEIFLASDNNYAPFIATTILSICQNTNRICKFYVLDGGITFHNKERILEIKNLYSNFSVEFIVIDTEKYFKDFIVTQYLSLATYYRFLIPILFPKMHKALYVDIDIIAKDDIGKLYDIDLDKYLIGAAKDEGDKNFINQLKSNLNMNQNSNYFNAGVLVIDFEKWRKEKITAKVFEIEKLYRGHLLCNDQDILNKCFESNYKLIDSKFNSKVSKNNTVIRHYYGNIKPWQVSPSLCKEEYEEFADFWTVAQKTSFYNDLLDNCKYKTNHQLRLMKIIKKDKFKQFINS